MTDFLNLTPLATRVLNDVDKRACRVHGCVKLPGFVFGSTRIVSGVAGEDDVSFLKIDDSDETVSAYQVAQMLVHPDANEAVDSLDCMVFAQGYLWVPCAILRDDGSGISFDPAISSPAFLRIDPNDITQQTYFENTIAATAVVEMMNGNAVCTDGEYIYHVQCSQAGFESTSGLYRFRIATETFDLIGTASFGEFTHPGKSCHAAVVDEDYVFASMSTVGDPAYLVKVDKRTGEFVGRVQIPQATDDMVQWVHPETGVKWLFLGWEVTEGNFGYGQNIGAIAVRKGDLAVFYLPKLGPEDNDTVTSYASLVFGDLLFDTKTNNHTYVIDLLAVDPSLWSTTMSPAQMASIVAKDITYDFPGAFFAGGNTNGRIPNEMMMDAEGVMHFFCWSSHGGFIGDNPPSVDTTSGYMRVIIPGVSAVPPDIVTLFPTGVGADGLTLRGFVDSDAGGTMVESGFFFDATSPPTTEYPSDLVPSAGQFTRTITPGPGTYFVQAFGVSSQGEAAADILQVTIPLEANRGFSGTAAYSDGAPAVGVSVYIIDTDTDEVVHVLTTDAQGNYSLSESDEIDMLRPDKRYHLFAALPGETSQRALSKTSRSPVPF